MLHWISLFISHVRLAQMYVGAPRALGRFESDLLVLLSHCRFRHCDLALTLLDVSSISGTTLGAESGARFDDRPAMADVAGMSPMPCSPRPPSSHDQLEELLRPYRAGRDAINFEVPRVRQACRPL